LSRGLDPDDDRLELYLCSLPLLLISLLLMLRRQQDQTLQSSPFMILASTSEVAGPEKKY
jgi:hypothetical protein